MRVGNGVHLHSGEGGTGIENQGLAKTLKSKKSKNKIGEGSRMSTSLRRSTLVVSIHGGAIHLKGRGGVQEVNKSKVGSLIVN